MLARVQRIEVGDAVDAKDHGFAVKDEPLLSVVQRGLGYPRITPGPVSAIAGEQPHAIVLPDDQHPVAVVFHFVKPVRPLRNLLSSRRQAELVPTHHNFLWPLMWPRGLWGPFHL